MCVSVHLSVSGRALMLFSAFKPRRNPQAWKGLKPILDNLAQKKSMHLIFFWFKRSTCSM